MEHANRKYEQNGCTKRRRTTEARLETLSARNPIISCHDHSGTKHEIILTPRTIYAPKEDRTPASDYFTVHRIDSDPSCFSAANVDPHELCLGPRMFEALRNCFKIVSQINMKSLGYPRGVKNCFQQEQVELRNDPKRFAVFADSCTFLSPLPSSPLFLPSFLFFGSFPTS